MSKKARAHTALLAANLIYGANYTIAKEAMPEFILPLGFILLRVTGALLLFWLFQSMMISERVAKKDMIRLAICGLFGVAINQMLFFKGLSMTTPINAAIIMTINPVLVLAFSAIFINEVITIKRSFGMILGLLGAALLIGYNRELGFSSDTLTGDVLVLINATSYAAYLVLVKPLMSKYQPLTIIKWVFLFGFIYVLPFGFNELAAVEWDTIPTMIWAAILYVVICTTFIAYLLNVNALTQLSPTVVSYYIYLQPLLATIVALLFAKDVLTPVKIISTLLIFAGVFLVSVPTASDRTTIDHKSD